MVERGSTRHSAQLDDELQKETESIVRGAPVEARADEWRAMEPPGDDEPTPSARIGSDEVELRSLLAISLRPSAFPGNRDRLISVAEEENAEGRILSWLEALPDDVEFATVEDVWEHLGGRYERRDAPLVGGAPAPTPAPVAPTPPRETATAHTLNAVDEDVPEPAGEPSLCARVVQRTAAGVGLVVGLTIGVVRGLRPRR